MKAKKLFLGLALSVLAVSCGTPAAEQEVKADSTAVDTAVVAVDSAACLVDSSVVIDAAAASGLTK